MVILSASSIWFTFEAMSSVNRPAEEKQWRTFSSKQNFVENRNSFGLKMLGRCVTPDYVVGVWVGNASGRRQKRNYRFRVAPVLFDIINILPSTKLGLKFHTMI